MATVCRSSVGVRRATRRSRYGARSAKSKKDPGSLLYVVAQDATSSGSPAGALGKIRLCLGQCRTDF